MYISNINVRFFKWPYLKKTITDLSNFQGGREFRRKVGGGRSFFMGKIGAPRSAIGGLGENFSSSRGNCKVSAGPNLEGPTSKILKSLNSQIQWK